MSVYHSAQGGLLHPQGQQHWAKSPHTPTLPPPSSKGRTLGPFGLHWAHLDNLRHSISVSRLATLIPSATWILLCHVTQHTPRFQGVQSANLGGMVQGDHSALPSLRLPRLRVYPDSGRLPEIILHSPGPVWTFPHHFLFFSVLLRIKIKLLNICLGFTAYVIGVISSILFIGLVREKWERTAHQPS